MFTWIIQNGVCTTKVRQSQIKQIFGGSKFIMHNRKEYEEEAWIEGKDVMKKN